MRSCKMKELVILILVSFVGVDSLVCKDDDGNDADWWIAYKLPKGEKTNPGEKYIYIDSNSQNKAWKLSSTLMGSTKSRFYRTVKPLVKNPNAQYVFYNDQFIVNGTHSKVTLAKAHAKGVAAYDKKSGIWIVHSIPNFFPNISEGYQFPDSGRKNGQAAICLSLSLGEMKKVAEQLTTLKPNVYQESDGLGKSLFRDVKPVRRKKLTSNPVQISSIKTLGGTTFTHFSKNKRSVTSIFDEISSKFRVGLRVQTWRNGVGGAQDSNCERKKNQVKNIDTVHVRYESEDEEEEMVSEWSTRSDHSKWAVSNNGKSPVVCVGDLNRMNSQEKRGGGFLCTQDPDIWNAFNDSVLEVEDC